MSIHDEISNLISCYSENVDSGDWDAMGQMFAYGSVELNGRRNFGAEDVANFYRNLVMFHDGEPRTLHVITNVIIEVASDEESAKARSYYTVLQCLPDFPLQIIAAGRYHDSFKKIDGEWRFVNKTILTPYSADCSRHSYQAAARK
jgi:3-phenylpropionate/cinnamic acid dioxygenase small subunit